MNLEVKDELYYTDLIADLKQISGIEEMTDTIQIDRIRQRRKMVTIKDEDGNLKYRSSDYSIEFMNMAREIYIKAMGFDGLVWLEQLRDFPTEVNAIIKELENKKIENEILIQLLLVINNMGCLYAFSLGKSREQCVCLNKNDKMWEVYLVERGIVFDKSVYEECIDACIEVIHQLADSKELFEEHKESFLKIKKLTPPKHMD